ncbi:hypothetical protein SAMN05421747_1063 [Parapedobacter composti]|uniref:HTH LytTR-type domain-containing protein n=1 Tax=Parapedobacter composti TaxID=623281 RepID=A0A1I1H5D9_9SPHI|nr:hypothetical protein [Parapedobacter composti]SFC18986.1 hypothetical protein SAMN05421747_1063 [Parapedobacter composti]
MEETPKVPDYDDRAPKLWAAAVAGLAICALGMREKLLVLIVEHFLAVMTVFLLTAGLAWCLIHYVSWQTRRLDRTLPWHTAFGQRLLRQLGWCVALPATVILLFAVAFFNALPQPVSVGDTRYFYADFPLAVLMLIGLSAGYGFAYGYWYVEELRSERASVREALGREVAVYRETIARLEEKNAALVSLLHGGQANESEARYSLTDKEGTHAILYTDIAYFRVWRDKVGEGRVNRFIQLVLLDGTVYVAKEPSLAKVVEVTGGYFVPIHRRYAVAPHGIKSCTQNGKGRLTLLLQPNDIPVKLSGRASRKLKAWVFEQVGAILLES